MSSKVDFHTVSRYQINVVKLDKDTAFGSLEIPSSLIELGLKIFLPGMAYVVGTVGSTQNILVKRRVNLRALSFFAHYLQLGKLRSVEEVHLDEVQGSALFFGGPLTNQVSAQVLGIGGKSPLFHVDLPVHFRFGNIRETIIEGKSSLKEHLVLTSLPMGEGDRATVVSGVTSSGTLAVQYVINDEGRLARLAKLTKHLPAWQAVYEVSLDESDPRQVIGVENDPKIIEIVSLDLDRFAPRLRNLLFDENSDSETINSISTPSGSINKYSPSFIANYYFDNGKLRFDTGEDAQKLPLRDWLAAGADRGALLETVSPKDNVEQVAAALLASLDVCVIPVSISEIAAALQIEVYFSDLDERNLYESLYVKYEDGTRSIFVNNELTTEHKRVLVAKELYHALLSDQKLYRNPKTSDELMARFEIYKEIGIEHRSLEFAQNLLMPRKFIEDAWPKAEELSLMAALFQVPVVTMEHRLVELGLGGELDRNGRRRQKTSGWHFKGQPQGQRLG